MAKIITRKLLCCLLPIAALFAGPALADMSGTWKLSVETNQGGGNPTFTLMEDNGKLSGTYEGALGTSPITGTVDGNRFTINFSGSAQGFDLKAEYTGTVEGDAIEGTLDLGGLASGTFTGVRE